MLNLLKTFKFKSILGVFLMVLVTVSLLPVDAYASTTLGVPFISQLWSSYYQVRRQGCFLTSLTMAVKYAEPFNDDVTLDNVYRVLGTTKLPRLTEIVQKLNGSSITHTNLRSVEDEWYPESYSTDWNGYAHMDYVVNERLPVAVLFHYRRPDSLCRYCHSVIIVGFDGNNFQSFGKMEKWSKFYASSSAALNMDAVQYRRLVLDNLVAYKTNNWDRQFIVHDPGFSSYYRGAFIPWIYNLYGVHYQSANLARWFVVAER